MDERLAHLDKNQIQDLMRRYYDENETATNLIEEYKIDVTPSRLYTLFPDVICDEKCRWCGEKLRMKALSKTALLSGYTEQEKICPKCGHIFNSRMCFCKGCVNERKRLVIEKERQKEIEQQVLREKIKKAYRRKASDLIKFEEISFLERVYLGTVMRGFLSEDLSTILPINKQELSP